MAEWYGPPVTDDDDASRHPAPGTLSSCPNDKSIITEPLYPVRCREMVLSDGDIRKAMREGELGIEPFHEKSLTPNGYDLSVESVLVPGSGARTESGSAAIPP